MRVMVTGSRDWRDIETVKDALWAVISEGESDKMRDYTLIQGCASGADAIARSIAVEWGLTVEDYWPDFYGFPFAEACLRRNVAMVESNPDVLLAFPTARSRGTWHAVKAAKKAGIEVRIVKESA